MTKLFLIVSFFSVISFAKAQKEAKGYYYYEKLYGSLSTLDKRADAILESSISEAKKSKNYKHLSAAYEDKIFFTEEVGQKFLYSDSALSAAILSKDPNEIGRAHLSKGVLFYFYERDYRKALVEYQKAKEHLDATENRYLKNKLWYHTGLVQSYMGYYKEAEQNFQSVIDFYSRELDRNLERNEEYNYRKGYLNTIIQLSSVYDQMGKSKESRKLAQKGFEILDEFSGFPLERGKLLSRKGVLLLKDKKYLKALETQKEALLLLKGEEDFTARAAAEFYVGRTLLALGKKIEARVHFLEVDRLFNEHYFSIPELKLNYELLIETMSGNSSSKEEELYYTHQLLNAEKIYHRHFPYLSQKLFSEFSSPTDLNENSFLGTALLKEYSIALITLGLFGVGAILFFKRKRKKNVFAQVESAKVDFSPTNSEKVLREAILSEPTGSYLKTENALDPFTPMQIESALKALETFEIEKGFLKPGIKVETLARLSGLSSKLISYAVNRSKEQQFNTYVNRLRIGYITKLLETDPKYLKYSVDSLGKECGINHRQTFTRLFNQFQGEPPKEFIDRIRKNRNSAS